MDKDFKKQFPQLQPTSWPRKGKNDVYIPNHKKEKEKEKENEDVKEKEKEKEKEMNNKD
jgi:hypothetical protein